MKSGTLQKVFVNKKVDGQAYLKLFLLAASGAVEKATLFDQWYFEADTDHDISQYEGQPVEYETKEVTRGDSTYVNAVHIQPQGVIWKKPAKDGTPADSPSTSDPMTAASLIGEILSAQMGAINETLYEIAINLKPKGPE